MSDWDEDKHPRDDNGQFASSEGASKKEPEVGRFGKIFTEFRHDVQGAIAKLKSEQGGEAIGALYHPEIGDIDLIWGETGDPDNDYKGGYGLAKIMGKHPEVVDDLQNIITKMTIDKTTSGANRLKLSSADGQYKGVVSLNWKGEKKKWLLTAFEVKENRDVIGKTMDTSNFSGASDTALCTNISTNSIERNRMKDQKRKRDIVLIAMDKSMRRIDDNGHLIVESTIITKAAVNPYLGKEVPDYEKLGLEPDKIYKLLRDPEELEKALSSFKGVQLLIKHTPVSSSEPHNALTVGSIGTDIHMDGESVRASLRVFDQTAIDLIESGKLQELSAGYRYVADMTPGEWNGQSYDGVMRNIHGNHVALVERGRIGRDAIISDHLPVELMEKSMKLKKGAVSVITEKLQTIAMDGDVTPEIVEGVIKTVADNILPEEPKATDSIEEVTEDEKELDTETKTKAEDEEGDKVAQTEDSESEVAPPAMDADAIEAAAVKRVTELFEAREAVKPLVGVVAMDSAEAVYRFALKQKGVNVEGVHPSAFKAMTHLLLQAEAKPAMALDAVLVAPADELTARFG
ncbi:hypothetical protein AAEX37_01964 [Oligella sp. MSHR50489EDL]|uniref:DUF2213 domain-containing protein n=1 Tax=Oligella sp. MSHR50489EDL TaxID=3139409 RepID=UPI003D819019